MGDQYVSTVVYALSARSAVGLHSASTVIGALYARSAVGVQSASTVVYAMSARSAVGQGYASMVVSVISAKTVTLRRPKHDTIPASDCSNSQNNASRFVDNDKHLSLIHI